MPGVGVARAAALAELGADTVGSALSLPDALLDSAVTPRVRRDLRALCGRARGPEALPERAAPAKRPFGARPRPVASLAADPFFSPPRRRALAAARARDPADVLARSEQFVAPLAIADLDQIAAQLPGLAADVPLDWLQDVTFSPGVRRQYALATVGDLRRLSLPAASAFATANVRALLTDLRQRAS